VKKERDMEKEGERDGGENDENVGRERKRDEEGEEWEREGSREKERGIARIR
jgi:hypothetical protein